MPTRSLSIGAVILAAGDGSRFGGRGGDKMLADLEGRPVLQHVFDTASAFDPLLTVVVLGAAMDRIGRVVDFGRAVRIWNPQPRRGLSSSIQVGMTALAAADEQLDGAFIVLGDQPRLRSATLERLVAAAAKARPADRPMVVPRYVDDPGPRNPVLLLRPAWTLVEELAGDIGLAALIDANPDIDTPGDLVRRSERPAP